MHARIQPVIPEQYALWCGAPASRWYSSLDYARSSVQNRPAAMWSHGRSGLGLQGTTELTLEVEPAGAGDFALTAVEVTPPFTGRFWTGIPVTVTAQPGDGWSDGETDASRSLVLEEAGSLVAVFE
jgi:hypothetical protein